MRHEERTAENLAAANWANRLTATDRANDAIERAELGACYGCRTYRCEGCTKPNALYAC